MMEDLMFTKTMAIAAAAAWATGLAFAQAGPGKGRMMEFGSNNAAGWSMMTTEERQAHRDKMHSFKSLDECKATMAEHAKLMEARAEERNLKHAGPRENACERMQQRGWFK
jgi:hypothetical protein